MRNFLARLLRQPLVQFVLIGAVIFGLYNLKDGDKPTSPTDIRVSSTELRWLHDTWIAQFGHAPNAIEMRSAVTGFVDEEMRYREGLALGLDRDDTIVRRRLAQKYDFLLGTQAADMVPTETQLRAFQAAHPANYIAPPLTSFCQAYFGSGGAGLASAKAVLEHLAPQRRLDPKAVTGGDIELPYPRCYASASAQDVAHDFGDFFGAAVAKLPVGPWQGPVESGYGFHLAIITARTPGAAQTFEAARPAIEADWRRATAAEARVRQDRDLRRRYHVTIDEAALRRIVEAAQ